MTVDGRWDVRGVRTGGMANLVVSGVTEHVMGIPSMTESNKRKVPGNDKQR